MSVKRPYTMSDEERDGTPRRRAASPAVEFVDEECTGKYEGAELQEMRSRRRTDLRIGRLEEKHDSLVREVGETRREVASMSGKLEVLPELVSVIRSSADRAAQREHVTFTAKVDVDKAQALDTLEARKDRRKTLMTIATALFTGGVIGKLLHWLGVF